MGDGVSGGIEESIRDGGFENRVAKEVNKQLDGVGRRCDGGGVDEKLKRSAVAVEQRCADETHPVIAQRHRLWKDVPVERGTKETALRGDA